jgi:lactoylglutathione lyase
MGEDAEVSHPKHVIEELFRRGAEGDATVVDELVAEDMVNHAAPPARQGRQGWKQIVGVIEEDLGADFTVEHHHLVAEGELVSHHLTIHGRHRASTMPLLADVPVTGNDVAWTFMHLWRVVDGQVVEHRACRDDVGLLRQVGAWAAPRVALGGSTG